MPDTTTPAAWRTYTGAEFKNVREIPCVAIANGQLIDAAGDPVYEDDPELAAEIDRRGRAVYRDHGYGEGHEMPGWGHIPAFGCDHRDTAASSTPDPKPAERTHDLSCPECFTDGSYLNIGRMHIGYCTGCQVSWCIGSNLFTSWLEETEDQQREEYDRVGIGTMRRHDNWGPGESL